MHTPSFVLRSLRLAALPALLAGLSACGSQPVVSADQMAKPRIAADQLAPLSDDDIQTKRDALASERAGASARYTQAEAQCWKRFAVTPCIDNAARERRATMDQLRADDIALQDEQRKRRLQRTEERLQGKQDDAKER